MANKEKEVKEAKEGKEKGGGMKKIIIFILALLLVGGGVFAGTYMFMQKNNNTNSESNKPTVVREKITETVYVDLGEITVNLADEGGKRYFKGQLAVGYDKESKDAAKELTDKKIVIRDAVIFYMKSLKSDFINDPKNEQEMKNTLMDRMNKQLTKSKVIDVRFDSIITQ